MTWQEFLKTHWNVLAATDFFTVELWTARGLIRYHVLFVIKLATREGHIAGLVPEPSGAWMLQVGRNLIDPWAGFLRSSRYLIHDRATAKCPNIRTMLKCQCFSCYEMGAGVGQAASVWPAALCDESRAIQKLESLWKALEFEQAHSFNAHLNAHLVSRI